MDTSQESANLSWQSRSRSGNAIESRRHTLDEIHQLCEGGAGEHQGRCGADPLACHCRRRRSILLADGQARVVRVETVEVLRSAMQHRIELLNERFADLRAPSCALSSSSAGAGQPTMTSR